MNQRIIYSTDYSGVSKGAFGVGYLIHGSARLGTSSLNLTSAQIVTVNADGYLATDVNHITVSVF